MVLRSPSSRGPASTGVRQHVDVVAPLLRGAHSAGQCPHGRVGDAGLEDGRPRRRARRGRAGPRTARRGRRRSAARPRPGPGQHPQRLDETVLPLPPVTAMPPPVRAVRRRPRTAAAGRSSCRATWRRAASAARAGGPGASRPRPAAPRRPASRGRRRARPSGRRRAAPARAATQSVATTWRQTSSGYHSRRWRMPDSSPTPSTKTSPAVTSRTAWPVRESQSATVRSRVGSTPRRETARSRAVSTCTRWRTSRVPRRREPGRVAGERRRQLLGEVVVDGRRRRRPGRGG